MKFITLFALTLVAGCSSKQSLDVSPCHVSPPPTLSGIPNADLVSLSTAWLEQTSNLGRCNDKLTKIRYKLEGEK